MDVVFMGTPEFAVPSLRALSRSHRVQAVFTRPDAVSRRGRRLIPPPVKILAEELGIDVHQPVTLRDPAVVDMLRALSPDVICVAAYGVILPPDVLAIPRYGCINVHASLLPRHRGAAPIHRAVLEGDDSVGVSIMLMEEGLDTGPFAVQRAIDPDALSVVELTSRLAELGAEALLGVLDSVVDGSVVWTAQDDDAATYAAKVTADDVTLTPELTVQEALRRVRAATAQAPSRITVGGTVVSLLAASPSHAPVAPGHALATKQDLSIGLADGAISLDRIRPAGKGDMSGVAYVCGARVSEGCTWESTR